MSAAPPTWHKQFQRVTIGVGNSTRHGPDMTGPSEEVFPPNLQEVEEVMPPPLRQEVMPPPPVGKAWGEEVMPRPPQWEEAPPKLPLVEVMPPPIREEVMPPPMTDEKIRGVANLAKFMTAHGFSVHRNTIGQWMRRGDGPPPDGFWANKYVWVPSEVLKWVRANPRSRVRTKLPAPGVTDVTRPRKQRGRPPSSRLIAEKFHRMRTEHPKRKPKAIKAEVAAQFGVSLSYVGQVVSKFKAYFE